MNRINQLQQLTNFVIFLIVQVPFLYQFVLFDVAFGFFYVGFILFLPFGLSRNLNMLIGLACGLIIDVFSNSPGIHAAACVFIAFVKDHWFLIAVGEPDEQTSDISWHTLRFWGLLRFALPLIYAHHFIVFSIENNGFHNFVQLLSKIVFSSLFTFTTILVVTLVISPKETKRR